MLRFCQFGAGRIGAIHAANLHAHRDAALAAIIDVDEVAAAALAGRIGARVASTQEALADPEIEAVVIASPTDTHADLIEASARAGKAIFCEKPLDLDIGRVEKCLDVVRETGVALAIGFNRRFDPSFAALRARIDRGDVGRVETVCITSRDPALPPLEYLKSSGGLFRDMMIHDFDMARWLLGEEPVQLFAAGSCLVDPGVEEVGDIDTAVVILKTASGVLCQISNSRRAVYGYDQRVEVFGDKGMVRAGNRTPTSVETATADGTVHDNPLYFFLERYAEAYRAELDAFIDALSKGAAPEPGGDDGLAALRLADAAWQSHREGRPVDL